MPKLAHYTALLLRWRHYGWTSDYARDIRLLVTAEYPRVLRQKYANLLMLKIVENDYGVML